MDQAADIGLGHHDRRVGHALADLAGQDSGFGRPPQNGPVGTTQDAETGLRLDKGFFGRIGPIGLAWIFINPGAEIDEVLVPKPAQEIDILFTAEAFSLARHGPGLNLRHCPPHEGQHFREVLNGGADIGQHRLDATYERGLTVSANLVQHHQDHGFAKSDCASRPGAGFVPSHLDNGVKHGADRQALLGDLPHDAVHQKGRVGLDDFQSVEPRVWITDQSQAWRLALSNGAEGPEIRQQTRQVLGAELWQVVRTKVPRRLLDKGLGGRIAHKGGEGGLESGFQGLGHGRIQIACGDFREWDDADMRTPPEESVRRRLAPPRGGGGALRRLGAFAAPWARGVFEPPIDGELAYKVKTPPPAFAREACPARHLPKAEPPAIATLRTGRRQPWR